ncbi:triphosphoribosyl-dephospho-CoA synthase [Aquincola tertiaricarbonis]|uniref:triphosphoribosyl-dephospho-CoA synthase n=1 Tax=Aquincola tertiaricarbonis TaxID=391953 RepID=UPI000614BD17|nr:triphosphoribosyl-dephospho-CoA synthase [Aquincola tertiaricarbonis]
MTGRSAFLRACALDVAVRKPGNVSEASPGHGMQAAQFIASAQAAAGPLFEPGARVGRRIEGAVQASWAAAGCNTNLGIVLLCAPLASAAELLQAGQAASLRAAIEQVLQSLDIDDAAAAFRAITQANPGGLGNAPQQDVHAPPSIGLREAMALAAGRDSIARQYRDGFAELFDIGLRALPPAFSLMAVAKAPDLAAAVQALYLAWLAAHPDSHIVRKHGEAVAHSVMSAAQGWQARAATHGGTLDADPAFIAWDDSLKARRINPGTTADLTVATLLLSAWHGT